jgi:hypothetical protein
MRRLVVAVLSAIVVGMMLVPGSVFAGKGMVTTIQDRLGDFGKYNVYFTVPTQTFDAPTWGGNAPFLQAGYVDMLSYSFGMVRGCYVFGMNVAADLPQEDTELPPGIVYCGWNLWIMESPWSPGSNAKTLYQVWLEFDGSSYSVVLFDPAAGSITTLPSSCLEMIDARTFQIRILPELIGNVECFWWSVGTFITMYAHYLPPWWVDSTDPGADPSQVGTDFPWPPA